MADKSPPEPPKEEPQPPWLRVPESLLEKFALPEPEPEDTGAVEEGELFPLPGEKARRRLAEEGAAVARETGETMQWAVPIPLSERALAIVFCTIASVAVLVTFRGYGLSWDEAYYYQPTLDAAGWVASSLRFDKDWASADALEAGFGRVWELPPVVKVANGLAWALASPYVGDLRAIRIPSAIAFGLTVGFVYILGWLAWRRVGAMTAAIVYATMPHVFGYAHLATSESFTTFVMVLAVYAFLRGLYRRFWCIPAAVFFALALATKINAVFLPAILLPWAWLHTRKESVNNLYAWAFLTPPLVVLFWPYLWHDTLQHALEYVAFATQHPKLGLWFEGQKWNYNTPAAPWYYPSKITVMTLPPLTAIAILAGVLLAIFRWKRTSRVGRLALWAALVLYGVVSLPSTPKYDGIRLFHPAMPFLAILAGGFVTRASRLGTSIRMPQWAGLSGRQVIVLATTLALGIGGVVSISLSHPHELSYYNIYVGGIEGADRRGYEVSYWGEALDKTAIDDMNRLLPPNARLQPLAIHDLALRILQQWGELRGDIRIGGPPPYDAYLLQYRKGFWGRQERELFERGTPVAVRSYGTVPLLLLYLENPARGKTTGGGPGADRASEAANPNAPRKSQ